LNIQTDGKKRMVYAWQKGEIMSADQIQSLATLPLQALLLVACVTLWRAYNAAQNARVDDLKQNYEKGLSDLRTRVMLLEDRAGIHIPEALNSSVKPVSSGFGAKDLKLD
jgi:hypothetical protein